MESDGDIKLADFGLAKKLEVGFNVCATLSQLAMSIDKGSDVLTRMTLRARAGLKVYYQGWRSGYSGVRTTGQQLVCGTLDLGN